jgi:hypothetical protein
MEYKQTHICPGRPEKPTNKQAGYTIKDYMCITWFKKHLAPGYNPEDNRLGLKERSFATKKAKT